jgi:hypothetical protein
MRNVEFLIYRLNYEHEETLFPNPIRSDESLLRVFEFATSPEFDLERSSRRAGVRWSLREFHEITDEELGRLFVVTLAKSELFRRGNVVTTAGIETGVSEPNPPLADTILILVEVKRHALAVEYDSSIMYSDEWHKQLERMLHAAARRLEYTTQIKVEPVPPRERFEAQFRKFQRVTRLRMTLRIPNPDIKPTFERLYKQMQAGRIRELTQDIRNPDGLNVSDDSLPRESLEMALSGYKAGTVHVTGVADGHRKTINFGEAVTQTEVEGIREYVRGIADGSTSPEVKKAARAIIRKVNEILDYAEHPLQ